MQNKFIFNTGKHFYFFIILIISLMFTQFYSGCGGSDEEVELTKREKDSMVVYIDLQKAFALYKKALTYNESGDNEKAKESFDASLKFLKDIDDSLISNNENYFWKQDYNELGRSIVEDYLITQTEISENSLVFEFARKIPVSYEKIEHVSVDKEPLPGGNDVPFIKNSAVEQYIEFFSNTERGRMFVDKCFYRSGKFFPLMRKILKLNNAPEELIYLSVQESGLNPTIVSRAGAVGLWQFMPATGVSYGLYQDGYRDDRRDFEKATDAAAHLLKDLYRTFDDWYLAFSAYNAGPGRVKKAISKSGSRDFWTLRTYLPGETKNYVPSIIALSFIFRNPEEYGFRDIEYGSPIAFDRVNIQCSISLQKIAELSGSDIETIRELNSEITNDEIPQYDVPYQIRIPHKSYDTFAANFKNSTDIDKSSSFSPEFAGNEVTGFSESVASVEYKVKDYEPADIRTIGSANGKKKVSHEYRRMQLLSAIAVYYDVRPTDIRLWNNLSYGTLLKANQKLDIYLTEDSYKKLYGKKEDFGENTNLTADAQDFIDKNVKTEPVKTDTDESGNDEEEENESETTKETGTSNPETVSVQQESTAPVVNSNNNENSSDELNKTEEVQTTYEQTSTDQTVTQQSESEEETEYVEETVTEQPQTGEPETKTVSNINTSNSKTYIVAEGDNLSGIAANHGVSVSDLMEWNDLESDKIMTGQKLKVHKSNTKISVHIVKEGDNLTKLADDYGMSLSEIKELNNLSDDKILVGQKLKVTVSAYSDSENKNSTKTSGVKKTHTVKKGETLASIAGSYDISVQKLMNWNNLKNDKILIGQTIKLYDNGAKTKMRKKKN